MGVKPCIRLGGQGFVIGEGNFQRRKIFRIDGYRQQNKRSVAVVVDLYPHGLNFLAAEIDSKDLPGLLRRGKVVGIQN